MANTLPHIAPGSNQDIMVAGINAVIDYINATQQTQTQNDGQTGRFLFGYQKGGFPGGDFGMKISPPGVEVTTAPLANLLFYWDFSTGTMYWNSNGINYRQDGLLPDGLRGLAIAQQGFNVSDGF